MPTNMPPKKSATKPKNGVRGRENAMERVEMTHPMVRAIAERKEEVCSVRTMICKGILSCTHKGATHKPSNSPENKL